MKRWILLGLLGILAALLLTAFIPQPVTSNSIELTRYVWNTQLAAIAKADQTNKFSATEGRATLIITRSCDSAWPMLLLNDVPVSAPTTDNSWAQDITLESDNRILVTTDTANTCTTVRITQQAQVQMHVLSRVHFNTNVSNFERAREFYGMLGFTTLSGFPDTNTQAMARAIGIQTPTSYDGAQGDFAGGYLLHGELVGPQGFAGGVIDLIEFSVPRNNDAPYAKLNHLGMTRAVMHTTDLDADIAYMTARDVNFLAPPARRADGTRFTIFTDPDGTSYELRQSVDAQHKTTTPSTTETTHINGLGAVAINVSDFKRSAAWYQMLGYQVTKPLPGTGSKEIAEAMGFNRAVHVDGAVVTHTKDASTLELTQWLSPWDPEPPYPLPVNHLGMHRMAFSTSDIESDVAQLKAQGVEFVSPITPCCSGDDSSGAIVAFYDPDGTVLELVEQPLMTPLLNLSMRVGGLFD